jgi:transcriptional regulator GlxA family with amidase domain
MGPIRYLTLHRMHQVRYALLSADASNTTVTRVAMAHGFSELGRFSVEYRSFFYESPSETLSRLPQHNAQQMPGDVKGDHLLSTDRTSSMAANI